ncbi:hypothetical protein, partial [Escherichia coli]|uniref:hypothetical protein n=1 Tax=Escherichia coli TaxID=562 RepID=UPI0034D55618
MCLIDDHGETLITQVGNTINDKREFLNRRNNELMNNVNDPFFDNLARRFFGPVSDWMDWATPAITSTAVNGLLTDVKETKDAYEVHV